jgi:ribonuclease-3
VKLISYFLYFFRRLTPQDRQLSNSVKQITGSYPINIGLYRLAMRHSSLSQDSFGFRESNERLEYLGDAVLGIIVAEYLFKKYPFKDEGFLTEIRSRLVNRDVLNQLSIKIGLSNLVEYEGKHKNSMYHKSLYGDAFEAFIGAMYLDKGFKDTRKFVVKNLIKNHFDLDEVVDTVSNHKSKLIEWAQKNNQQLSFQIDEDTKSQNPRNRQFKAVVKIGEQTISEGYGYSKKKASQDAARKAIEVIENTNKSE